ncbi:hypothetical protein CMQ_3128 [Grosmannia clavigera kw1407]|uniref:Uncharacterized protein n=1 Tax=Grosmannia clavigera (strain kw1407 / UAMH 11150) TaxID=655863 RepID=F0XI27_GROCL|nr:uncharacterized protein CMQ_3128 [Grosmannia clavigera kw1407]EFX03199.1 hypothetical protein CMQ_3128 [Grosmannia clavigera kw1407]
MPLPLAAQAGAQEDVRSFEPLNRFPPPLEMPPIHPVAVTAGVIALSVAVATAIAIYESPEVRRRADELRRRIAIALQSLSDNIAPNDHARPEREPMFNRPEDAEGFMMSSHGAGGDPNDVVADEASRRRQREEILYWNRQHLERQRQLEEQEKREAIAAVEKATRTAAEAAGIDPSALPLTSFDQLLRPDGQAERGTFVVNTGADYGYDNNGTDDPLNGSMVRRRRAEGVRGLNASVYTNPFSDEYGIELDEQHDATPQQHSLRASLLSQGAYIAPEADELLSDIYNASERPETPRPTNKPDAADAPSAELLELALAENEFSTAGQDPQTDDGDAYNSIQAWAHTSSFANGFYSPLPVSPVAAPSEPDVISAGELTPTDSLSVVDAPLHTSENGTRGPATTATTATASTTVVGDAASQAGSGRYYDMVSDSEDGESLMTPTSWTEVGSVVSESDAGRQRPV